MSDIKGLREISNDPFGRLLTALSKKFSAFLAKDQADSVENPEDIYSDGQDVESAVKYHNFSMAKKFNVSTPVQYYTASEPNLSLCKVILGGIFLNLGEKLIDNSGFNNDAWIGGDPILVDGAPFDWGIFDSASNTKSIAIQFNRPTSDLVNDEWLEVEDNTSSGTNQVASDSTGFSAFIRIRFKSIAQQGGQDGTIFEKIDDSTPNYGFMLKVTPAGKLVVDIVRAGSIVAQKETAASTIVINTVYDIWVTFAVSGNVTHIYVNNVDKTLSANADPIVWHGDNTNHSFNIMRRGFGSDGHIYGDFYYFMLFKGDIVSSTRIGQHFTNKITTANIPFGQVNITNYGCTN